jgi:hypothetical protein
VSFELISAVWHTAGKKARFALAKRVFRFERAGDLDEVEVEVEGFAGDRVVVQDTGAHGHAMGFTYNGKLRPKELLLRNDGAVELIRRKETPEDYFATLDFEADRFAP